MDLFICEICGEAYIGSEKPTDCPFCGAKKNFLKSGEEARPIVNEKLDVSEQSRANLMETLALETRAVAIYLCMAGKTKEHKTKAMYKRLAQVEKEHAVIATKILGIPMPEINPEICSDEDAENFKKTVELEEHATSLYVKFAAEATERNAKIFFTALAQVEKGHIDLVKKLLA